MEKKSPWLLFAIIIAILAVVASYRYYQYAVRGNFTIDVNTACDSAVNNCFVSDCSPEDDPGCLGYPYEKVEISASEAPQCILEHTCDSFSCDGLQGCSVTYCSDDSLDDGESCTFGTSETSEEEPATDNEK